MNEKSNTKRIIGILQMLAVFFLLSGIICRIFFHYEYDLLLFGKPFILNLTLICFFFFYLIEVVSIVFIVKKTKKKLFFLTYLILIPLLFFQIFVVFFTSSSDIKKEIYKYPEFDASIVMVNGHDLFGDYTEIYETQNNIVLKSIAVIDADSLEDESLFDIEIEGNKLIYTFHGESSDEDDEQVVLAYNDGHFKEVTDRLNAPSEIDL